MALSVCHTVRRVRSAVAEQQMSCVAQHALRERCACAFFKMENGATV